MKGECNRSCTDTIFFLSGNSPQLDGHHCARGVRGNYKDTVFGARTDEQHRLWQEALMPRREESPLPVTAITKVISAESDPPGRQGDGAGWKWEMPLLWSLR